MNEIILILIGVVMMVFLIVLVGLSMSNIIYLAAGAIFTLLCFVERT